MPVSTPTITSNSGGDTAAISVAEGVTAVTTVTATDIDDLTGATLSYKIAGGKDASKFSINADTGVLVFKSAPDFEAPGDSTVDAANVANGLNTYEVWVQVSDAEQGDPAFTDLQKITVTVTNVNAVTLTGDGLDNVIGPSTATVEADTLNGLGGNDTLDGGAGADIMNGGLGNDIFIVDNASDQANENAGEGTADEVRAKVDYDMTTLAAQVEKLTLTGVDFDAIKGFLDNIDGTGNALNNTITGNAGNNVINGGAGADAMAGGLGNDTYIVDNAGDTVTEGVSAGTDEVESSVNFTLGDNIERLTLTGTAATGTGNALSNTITGNASNNTLSGLDGNDIIDGGEGADAMTGGAGNDRFIVDNV